MTFAYLARSSMSRYFAASAFLAGLIQLQSDRLWIGEWDMGPQAAVNYSLVAVLAVAAGSVLDARAARSTVPDLAAGARDIPPHYLQVLASAFWGYVVLILLTLVVLGTNAAVSAWRVPNLAILLAGLAWLTLHSAIGWLLGWNLPFGIAVPLVLLLSWLFGAVPAATPDAAANLLTAIDDGGFPAGTQPRTAVILTQIVVLLALAALAVVPTFWRQLRPAARSAYLGTPVLALLLAMLSVSITGPQRRVELVDATSPRSCTEVPVDACSFPDHVRRRDAAARLAETMWAPLATTGRPVPAGVIEDRLKRPDDWIPVNLWAQDAGSAALDLARGTASWQLCGRDHAEQRALGQGANQRVAWLIAQLNDSSDPVPYGDAIAPILRMPLAEQIAWWYQRPADASCG